MGVCPTRSGQQLSIGTNPDVRLLDGDRLKDREEGRETAEIELAARDQGNGGVQAATRFGGYDSSVVGGGGE
jgi:hypothetical protein